MQELSAFSAKTEEKNAEFNGKRYFVPENEREIQL